MDDAGQGSRRGEYAKQGDGVAFREQPAFDTGRTEYLGRIAWTAGDRARLESGEVVSLNDLVVVPSPEEIEESREAIKAGWSEEVKERRWMAFTWEHRRAKDISGKRYWADCTAEDLLKAAYGEQCGGGWRRQQHVSSCELGPGYAND